MSETSFDFNVFIKESKDVLITPKSFFSMMKTTGGIAEPLIKALIYGAVAGIIAFIWSLLNIRSGTAGLIGSGIGIMIIVGYIIGAVIGLFIGADILFVISTICKGNVDFEANMRVIASVLVLLPISALLGFISEFSYIAGVIVGLALNIFALYLLYHGLVEALKANQGTSKIVIYILAGLLVIITLVGMIAKNRVVGRMDTDLKELMQDMQNK